MAAATPIYYSNLFKIEDFPRKKKFQELLLLSLQNDLDKWSETFVKLQNNETRTRYLSPNYGDSRFVIDTWTNVVTQTIAYVTHKTPIISNYESELICTNDDMAREIKDAISNLKSKVYTQDIYDIEKMIGNQYSRKEKLNALELEQLKPLIEDTYNDWMNNQNDASAELIAKLIYSYRKNKEFYELWIEKFKDFHVINTELKKIKGEI